MPPWWTIHVSVFFFLPLTWINMYLLRGGDIHPFNRRHYTELWSHSQHKTPSVSFYWPDKVKYNFHSAFSSEVDSYIHSVFHFQQTFIFFHAGSKMLKVNQNMVQKEAKMSSTPVILRMGIFLPRPSIKYLVFKETRKWWSSSLRLHVESYFQINSTSFCFRRVSLPISTIYCIVFDVWVHYLFECSLVNNTAIWSFCCFHMKDLSCV